MSQIVKFGVVTDVQYADNDNAPAWYDPRKTRYYRNSLYQVHNAFKHWNEEWNKNIPGKQKTGFVLQLGDIIDGINRKSSHEASLQALSRTLDQFECNPHIPTFHTVGNHELYNFKRSELAKLFQESLLKRMKINSDVLGLDSLKLLPENPNSDEMTLYYKFTPNSKVKLIALDCFDISVIGHDPSHEKYKIAEEILYQKHGHYDFDGWDLDDHLVGPDRRFQSSNGAISKEQLDWLDAELTESDANNELVIIFGHVGVHPESSDWNTIIWNYDEVIACFNKHPSVVAYFCGHSHVQGYTFYNGVHYVVFHGIIETSPEFVSFATVTLYEDRMEIEGHGLEKSRILPLKKKQQDNNDMESMEQQDMNIDETSQDFTHTPEVRVEV